MGFPMTETQYGFQWGPASIERVASATNFGVVLLVEGRRERLEIRVTAGGSVRVYGPFKKRKPTPPRGKKGKKK